MSDVIPIGKKGKVCPSTVAYGIGQRFQELREAMMLSRETMAWKVGLSIPSLKNYELGYRATDLDALFRFVRVFNAEVRETVLEWLIVGGKLPALNHNDTVSGRGMPERLHGYRLLKLPHGIAITMRVRHVREEIFKLGRPEFSDKIKSQFSAATISDYEMSRRSVSLVYVTEICNAAANPLDAWGYMILAPGGSDTAQRAWLKIKNSSMSGAPVHPPLTLI